MEYCFYETTNLVNGKKYLGIHSSKCLEKDNYLGSGTLLREAIKKYGKENFRRRDIKLFGSIQEAKQYEADQITGEILRDTNYYNIAPGGGGGIAGARPYHTESKRFMVAPEAIPKFLKEHPDAVEGIPEEYREAQKQRMLGRVAINNGSEHKLVPQEDVQKYLNNGWTIGTTEKLNRKNSESKKGIRVMHLGNKTRHVRLEDVSKFLEHGYSFGPSEWISKKQGKSHKGLVKIHKDQEIRFISEDKLDEYLNLGFKRGSSAEQIRARQQEKLGRKTVHRGTEERNVRPEELPGYLDEGWILGRLPRNRMEASRARVKIQTPRIKEEAATRKLIYTKSSEYREWWEIHKNEYGRIHYGVCHFLEELGQNKESFLEHMKQLKEI